ncbi:MAG: transcription-repair coupling factor [Lachnospiraceae bacterium]|nr:transcription-repair coupling factor [Lachnospiraceae bacterium]
MRALLAPLREIGEYDEIRQLLLKKEGNVNVNGCVDSQKLHMFCGLGDGFKYKIIVTFNDIRVNEILEDARIYDRNVVSYPAKDMIFYQADIHGNKLTTERMRVLRRILEGVPTTIVTTFDALQALTAPLESLRAQIVRLQKGRSISVDDLSVALVAAGYEKVYQVEVPGQFAVRGGIVDIFDLTEENPYRMELWGDEIDSLRSFDAESQRSVEELSSVSVYPATELVLTSEVLKKGLDRLTKDASAAEKRLRDAFRTEEAFRIREQIRELKEQVQENRSLANLESYLTYFCDEKESFLSFFDPKETILCLDEPQRLKEHGDAITLEFTESMKQRLEKGYALPGQALLLKSVEETCAMLQAYRAVSVSSVFTKNPLVKAIGTFAIETRSIASYNSDFEGLIRDLARYKKEKYRVLLLSGSRTRAGRLAKDLSERELAAFYTDNPEREIQPGEIMVAYGHINKGFVYPLIKYVILSEGDIFEKERKKKRPRKKYAGDRIRDFAELHVGDYVVHENHGLGVYRGIEKVEMDHVVKDYMKIEYRDGGNLYILASSFDAIQKYGSSEAKKPKLNKLGTQEWSKTKSKAREATMEIAQDLVNLYASRQQHAGFRFDKDTIWQREFEETFPFEETEDQLNAIADTKRDMESDKSMDRLICGDVGYGKTEVAIRAAFKALQSGKQVVFLVPTTILAQQHYNTFVQRMKDFPVRVDMLSRFRTAAEQKKTIEDLKKGLVDIVIGTHRVLSKDVAFKDLGLLIIDEEQRFGVAHKEKIKQLKENIDVLALSATPIPRTLHMSLVGIRDMSVLEEAPGERMPIQTFVCEYNDEMVREAITRELARNGQVYYVYNRVNNIADVAAKLGELVPEANVAYAHGQMPERQLEKIMYDFIDGTIDVLVSTTIIETGLDISNVNTMIIHDSDNMGLSQLYQLRGRVGRSNRNAYAFLMYKRDKMLKEVAEKRLQAIREFTELGSGFKIAMRDLEIRGAGNLLGKRQHGHMEAVGYDLYCKMLGEAVKKMKGEEIVTEFETQIDLDVDAYIPGSYILNEIRKLDIYKRIAEIETSAEAEDMKEELLDRFGEIPTPVSNLLRIALIKRKAHALDFTSVQGKSEQLTFTFKEDAAIRVEQLPVLLGKYKDKLTFSGKGTPYLTYRYRKSGIPEKDGEKLLSDTEELLATMEELLSPES